MRRSIATVELTEDDDGSVSARIEPTGRPLRDGERRAVVRAVAVALEVVDSDAERDEVWSAEVAHRRASLSNGVARTISADELIARLEQTARLLDLVAWHHSSASSSTMVACS